MIGKRLGPYVVERELGAGGMGTVYAATLAEPTVGLDAGERVALKVIHDNLLHASSFLDRFVREAEIGDEDLDALRAMIERRASGEGGEA